MQIIDAHHHLRDIENRRCPHMKGPESVRIRGPNARLRKNYLVEDFSDSGKRKSFHDDAARTHRI